MDLFENFNLIVTKRILLFEAALVWTFAGAMLLYRGIVMLETSGSFSWTKIIICLCSGLLFFWLVFSKISLKHIIRIKNLNGKNHLFHQFFSPKSYLMMLGMISLGVFLRKSYIIPASSLSLAYITMGIPLLLSSIRFYHSWYYYLPVIDSSLT